MAGPRIKPSIIGFTLLVMAAKSSDSSGLAVENVPPRRGCSLVRSHAVAGSFEVWWMEPKSSLLLNTLDMWDPLQRW